MTNRNIQALSNVPECFHGFLSNFLMFYWKRVKCNPNFFILCDFVNKCAWFSKAHGIAWRSGKIKGQRMSQIFLKVTYVL